MGDNDERVEVQFPESADRRALLDRLARYVSKDGAPLESIIAQREVENPDYVCLREPKSRDGLYYRWKVYSLLMGDKEHRWRTKPFQMAKDGKFWVPPEMPPDSESDEDEEVERRERQRQRDRQKMRDERYKFSTGAQLEKARERAAAETRNKEAFGGKSEKSGSQDKEVDIKNAIGFPLRDSEFEELQRLLQNLDCGRPKIKECMGFALDYAECSGDIVDLIKESLLVDETPIAVKMARLFVLSDILYNASAPVRHASTYRMFVQNILPEVLEHLNKVYRQPSLGRMTASAMEEKVMALLAVWERWSLYPPLFINGLEATFQRKMSDLESDAPLLASGIDASALDFEELKRQARINGVYFDKDGSAQGASAGDDAVRLFKKVFHAQQYFRVKTQDPYGPSTSSLSPGLPTDDPEKGLQTMLAGASQKDYQNPLLAMAAASSSSSISSGARGQWGSVDAGVEDDEDLDGEDLDGEAIDDLDGEDLDGESMDSESAPSSDAPSSLKKRKPTGQGSRFSDESDGSSDEEDSRLSSKIARGAPSGRGGLGVGRGGGRGGGGSGVGRGGGRGGRGR